MKKTFYSVLLALIVVFAFIFSVQNTAQVDVRFITWDLKMALAYIIFLSILTGIIIAGLWFFIKAFKYKKEIKRLNKQCKSYEDQLAVSKKGNEN